MKRLALLLPLLALAAGAVWLAERGCGAEADAGEPGTVAAVFQKGYRIGDVILRHAMVQVVGE